MKKGICFRWCKLELCFLLGFSYSVLAAAWQGFINLRLFIDESVHQVQSFQLVACALYTRSTCVSRSCHRKSVYISCIQNSVRLHSNSPFDPGIATLRASRSSVNPISHWRPQFPHDLLAHSCREYCDFMLMCGSPKKCIIYLQRPQGIGFFF